MPVFAGTPADYKPIRAELDKHGLKCTTVTILTSRDQRRSAPTPRCGRRPSTGSRTSSRSTTSSGPETVCGPYHSALGVFSGSGPDRRREEARRRRASRQAAEVAKQANLMLAIEYLNRFECYFLTTAAGGGGTGARRSTTRTSAPCTTRFHAHIEEKDPAAAIRTVAPVLAHVHISENDRGTPGTGQVNWDETFKTLEGDRATTAGW